MTSWLRHFHNITFNISTSKTVAKFYQRSSITIFIDVFNRIKRLEEKISFDKHLKGEFTQTCWETGRADEKLEGKKQWESTTLQQVTVYHKEKNLFNYPFVSIVFIKNSFSNCVTFNAISKECNGLSAVCVIFTSGLERHIKLLEIT